MIDIKKLYLEEKQKEKLKNQKEKLKGKLEVNP